MWLEFQEWAYIGGMRMFTRGQDIRGQEIDEVWVFIPLTLCPEPCANHYSAPVLKAIAFSARFVFLYTPFQLVDIMTTS